MDLRTQLLEELQEASKKNSSQLLQEIRTNSEQKSIWAEAKENEKREERLKVIDETKKWMSAMLSTYK